MGHVRDLPKSGLGIETSDGSFEPSYRVMPDKRKIITELKRSNDLKQQSIIQADTLSRKGIRATENIGANR